MERTSSPLHSAPLLAQDTPNADAYPRATGPLEFTAEIEKNPVQQSYRFLGEGRRRSLYAHMRDGKVTPGRYLVSDSISECAPPQLVPLSSLSGLPCPPGNSERRPGASRPLRKA